MPDRVGWHMQVHFSLCVHQFASAQYASSNLGRGQVVDAVYLQGQITRQPFVVVEEQACRYDKQ